MEWAVIILVALGTLLVLLSSGMRVAFALPLVGMIVVAVWMGIEQELLLGHQTFSIINSVTLSAIPLFIFMGEIIFQSGLSKRIYASIAPTLSHFSGSLLHSNIAVGAVFAAASGSSMANAATIGMLSLPEMERRGYHHGIAVGSVAAGGSLGTLIPPSIILIIYGVMVQESIGRLFIAGILPGLMLAALYMTYIAVRVRLQPHLAPPPETVTWKKSLRELVNVWPIFFLIIVVLGSIYFGVATPTEAAAVGSVGALFLSFVYRCFSWKMIKASALGAVKITSMTTLIYLGAKLMGSLLTTMGVISESMQWVVSLPIPPLGILAAIVLMYIILGMFMSGLAAIVITLPITFPIIMALGYNPIWFGIIVDLLVEAGSLSPPVGMILYILHGLRPDRPFSEVALGCLPFFLVILVGITILVAFPPICTFLPNLMMGT